MFVRELAESVYCQFCATEMFIPISDQNLVRSSSDQNEIVGEIIGEDPGDPKSPGLSPAVVLPFFT